MSELVAALAGALAGAVLGGIFQDAWSVRRSRLRASASALVTLNLALTEMRRMKQTLESEDDWMFEDPDLWISPQLPPRVLESRAQVAEDLPSHIIGVIAECDSRIAMSQRLAGHVLPTLFGKGAIASGLSSKDRRATRDALAHDFGTAAEILARGIGEIERYHRDLSDFMASGD